MTIQEQSSAGLDQSQLNKDADVLLDLQRETFDFFLAQVDPETGLVADKTDPDSHASIAVVGMALSAYVVGTERKLLSRTDAISRTLKILHFFQSSYQGTATDATGYKGFYYHFLDMHTGKRAWQSELSTIDTTFFIAGALASASYFTGESEEEAEIRRIAEFLYRRIDWVWALNGGTTISHGWKPESGFLPYRWALGYSEAHLLYALALGSPTFPVTPDAYSLWTSTFECKTVYNTEYIYAGPLFIHQFSHMWIDFRGIHDAVNKRTGIDYFENSRRATNIHRQYAVENPQGFSHYGINCWGFTASDGPGNRKMIINGVSRTFHDYIARGAPFGPDDGTVAPWAVVASLPFEPRIVIAAIHHAIERLNLKDHRLYGFDASFNPTYPEKSSNPNGWVSPWRFGLNQGPVVIMIENYQSELLWKVMQNCPYLSAGLRRAGFSGGWLEGIH
jgi:hypothetical protein